MFDYSEIVLEEELEGGENNVYQSQKHLVQELGRDSNSLFGRLLLQWGNNRSKQGQSSSNKALKTPCISRTF